MSRLSKSRNRICRSCVVRSMAGVAWPMWGGRDGWPRLNRCRSCATAPRD